MVLPSSAAVFSAPGKVILFGEHSVAFGKRALACSVDLRIELTVSRDSDGVYLNLPEINLEKSWSIPSLTRLWDELESRNLIQNDSKPHYLSREKELVLRSFLEDVDEKVGKNELSLLAFFHLYTSILSSPSPLSVRAKSEIPLGAGLGSSAAFGVCLSGALLWAAGGEMIPPLNSTIPTSLLEIISEWAFFCDSIIHGKCSGIDNSVCTFGGCVNFKGGNITHFEPSSLNVLLVNTNSPRNTIQLVKSVKEKYDRLPSIMEPLLVTFDELVEKALTTLESMKDLSTEDELFILNVSILSELIDMNHCLLKTIGVSHQTLEKVVSIAKRHNLHAKLTGAGGGGFALILLPPNTPETDIEACLKALNDYDFTVFSTELGGQGLRCSNQLA